MVQPTTSTPTYSLQYAYKVSTQTIGFKIEGNSALTLSDYGSPVITGGICDGTKAKVYTVVDGNRTYGDEYGAGYDYTSNALKIFAPKPTGGDYFVGKIFYFTIYDSNDNVIADFVPCYLKSNTTIGLYDAKNKIFYANAGTGSFTKGGDI